MAFLSHDVTSKVSVIASESISEHGYPTLFDHLFKHSSVVGIRSFAGPRIFHGSSVELPTAVLAQHVSGGGVFLRLGVLGTVLTVVVPKTHVLRTLNGVTESVFRGKGGVALRHHVSHPLCRLSHHGQNDVSVLHVLRFNRLHN